MQKVLKQDLHKFVIHVNKSRPAAKDHSQSTANEGCENLFNIFKFNNQYDMSTSAPTAMHAICIKYVEPQFIHIACIAVGADVDISY